MMLLWKWLVESAGLGGNMIGFPVQVSRDRNILRSDPAYLLIALISSYAVNPEGAGT